MIYFMDIIGGYIEADDVNMLLAIILLALEWKGAEENKVFSNFNWKINWKESPLLGCFLNGMLHRIWIPDYYPVKNNWFWRPKLFSMTFFIMSISRFMILP